MHVIQRPIRQRVRKRMYLPSERMVVNGVGLGELDGMFNIGKMFTRMFTFTPSSFKMKNIAGAIGSVTTTIATGGLANIASELTKGKGGSFTSAHSKAMKTVGYGTMAAAAAVGAYYGGSALLSSGAGTAGATGTGLATTAGTAAAGTGIGVAAPTVAAGGFFSTVGTGLSTVGGWLGTGIKALTTILPAMGMMGGKGGGQPQQEQGGMTQAQYDAQQQAAYDAGQQQQQAAYVAQQQAQMYQPGMMQDASYMAQQNVPSAGAYGDLRSPYVAVTENGEQVQVDPMTGQVIPSAMSTDMMIGVGAVVFAVAGWYFLTPSSKSNN